MDRVTDRLLPMEQKNMLLSSHLGRFFLSRMWAQKQIIKYGANNDPLCYHSVPLCMTIL